VLAFLGLSLEYSSPPIERTALDLGFTYSVSYTEFLELDPIKTFEIMLSDLSPSIVRIPVYWSRIEPKVGEYDFTEIDKLMTIAESNDTKVILAIGRKVPRWPECFLPKWSSVYDEGQLRAAQTEMIRTVVNKYKDHPSLYRWQVENEPYFYLFGECPKLDIEYLEEEYDFVRSLDSVTEIQATVSGEQELWIKAAKNADVVGASMYRTTHTPGLGQLTYPIPPWTYRAKNHIFTGNRTVISELQMEPWFARSLHTYTIPEQLELFNTDSFEEHLNYAQSVGIKEVSLWGAEWWYYLDANGESSLKDAAIEVFNK
jgi:hypothetical protein